MVVTDEVVPCACGRVERRPHERIDPDRRGRQLPEPAEPAEDLRPAAARALEDKCARPLWLPQRSHHDMLGGCVGQSAGQRKAEGAAIDQMEARVRVGIHTHLDIDRRPHGRLDRGKIDRHCEASFGRLQRRQEQVLLANRTVPKAPCEL
ncbi:MAG: hypothetical protein ACRD0F_08925 [Acidimicrobiales bacterium]